MAMLPPLPAIGSAIIELLGPLDEDPNSVWDAAIWDGGESFWMPLKSWQNVTPQSVHVQITWGADDIAGALSATASGSWAVTTYDPERLLDPSARDNPFKKYLQPGGAIRILFRRDGFPDEVVRTGFIDEVEYDMASRSGAIRATDGIALMVKAQVPAGLQHDTTSPVTLRARARWILKKVNIDYITVEANPSGELDPVVGPPLDVLSSAWQQIQSAALDALYAVWLDRDGILRFRWFGNPVSSGVKFGEGIDGMDVDTIGVKGSMEAIYNHFIAQRDSLNAGDHDEAKSDTSITLYGDLVYHRERPNPQSLEWVRNLMVDRKSGALRWEIGTIRPQTAEHLISLLDLGVVNTVWTYFDVGAGEILNYSPIILGGAIEANVDSGWSASLVGYSRESGFYPQTKKSQRRATIYRNKEIWHNYQGVNGGANVGAQLTVLISPMEKDGDEQHEALFKFQDFNWTGVANLTKAVIRMYRPMHTDDPTMEASEEGWIQIERCTEDWDESEIWPGPTTTETGQAFRYLEPTVPEWFEVDITDIVRSWAPTSIAGGGQPNYGIKVFSYWGALQPEQTPQHFLLSGRTSEQECYILATVQMA